MESKSPATVAPKPSDTASAYSDLFDRSAIDAAFLWVLRSIAVNQPHYLKADLAVLEQRIDAQLDLLMSSIELGWEACESALALQQSGEIFTASVIALRSHDTVKIQAAIQSGLENPTTVSGVVSALGWLPAEIARPWVDRLLKGKDMNHKWLGVSACSVRREDPGVLLSDILKREDCRQHASLHARSLRLVGELRRLDLMPALQAALNGGDETLQFWATWSAVLLGQHALAKNLRAVVLRPGPLQVRAIQLAFRVLPIEQGREWISALAKDPDNLRMVITATGVLGDPHAVNWLIGHMSDTAQARQAGEAFTLITGIELEKHSLTTAAPAAVTLAPSDDPADSAVGLNEDENLPWPDADRIAVLWRNHGQHFLVGRRYFLGKNLSPEWLRDRLNEATQRQRHAAALELALLGDGSLNNTCARVLS